MSSARLILSYALVGFRKVIIQTELAPARAGHSRFAVNYDRSCINPLACYQRRQREDGSRRVTSRVADEPGCSNLISVQLRQPIYGGPRESRRLVVSLVP